MKGFANVFLLELRLRRAVFPAALVTGLIPIPMALLMSSVASFSESVNMGAAAFAFLGGVLLAEYLGGTVLCQDLSEGRQGFYLSRPIGAFALWAGKLAAAWAAVLWAVFVCLLPATLLGGGLANMDAIANPFWVYDLGPQEFSPLWGPFLGALGFLALLALAHAISVMFRARSLWLLLDAAMVVLLPALAWWALRRVGLFGSGYVLALEATVLCVGLFLGLLAAGAVQTVVGRADLRRGHRALSLTLWGILGLSVLAVDAHALWATNLSPSDLSNVTEIQAAPAGPWIIVSGPLKHRGPRAEAYFLVNSETGVSQQPRGSLSFSPDGRRAVAFEWHSMVDRSPIELVDYDLTGPKAQAHPTNIILSGWDTAVAFAPDGSRLAVLSGTDLTIYDLPSWRLAAAQKIDQPAYARKLCRLYFLDRETVRLCLSFYEARSRSTGRSQSMDLFEFAVAARKLSRTGAVEGAEPWTLRVNAAGDHMLVARVQEKTTQLVLCDARTGAIQKALSEGTSRRASARFLWDGRIVMMDHIGGSEKAEKRTLRILSPEGEEQRAVEMDGRRNAALGDEPVPGQVLVLSWEPHTWVHDTGEASLLDAGTGTIVALPGLRPQSLRWWTVSPRLETAPGAPGLAYFPDAQGKLVRHDFQTGTSTAVKF